MVDHGLWHVDGAEAGEFEAHDDIGFVMVVLDEFIEAADAGEGGAAEDAVVAGDGVEPALLPMPVEAGLGEVPLDEALAVDAAVAELDAAVVAAIDEAAGGADLGGVEGGDERLEPAGLGDGVIVDEGDEVAAGGGDALVAGDAEDAGGGAGDGEAIRIAGEQLLGVVGGGAVDDDDLEVAVGLAIEGVEAAFEDGGAVVSIDDHADGEAGGGGAAGQGLKERGELSALGGGGEVREAGLLRGEHGLAAGRVREGGVQLCGDGGEVLRGEEEAGAGESAGGGGGIEGGDREAEGHSLDQGRAEALMLAHGDEGRGGAEAAEDLGQGDLAGEDDIHAGGQAAAGAFVEQEAVVAGVLGIVADQKEAGPGLQGAVGGKEANQVLNAFIGGQPADGEQDRGAGGVERARGGLDLEQGFEVEQEGEDGGPGEAQGREFGAGELAHADGEVIEAGQGADEAQAAVAALVDGGAGLKERGGRDVVVHHDATAGEAVDVRHEGGVVEELVEEDVAGGGAAIEELGQFGLGAESGGGELGVEGRREARSGGEALQQQAVRADGVAFLKGVGKNVKPHWRWFGGRVPGNEEPEGAGRWATTWSRAVLRASA